MEFSGKIFDGMPIGKEYVDGTQVCCGDKVLVSEQITEQDYNHPILDFDRGTFRLREIYRIVQVEGVICYSPSFCGFVFVPEKVHGTACRPCECVSYAQKPVWSYEFKEMKKID